MHAWPQHHDSPRDPILDGRDTLRLVKLRLGLTLLAVAILPIAAVSPLVRAVAEEARVTHHERLADQAKTAVASFQREVSRIQAAERLLLDDPAIEAAAAADAAVSEKSAAYSRLSDFVAGDRGAATDGEVLAATLLNGNGVVSGFGTPLDAKTLPPQLIVTGLASVPGTDGQGYRLLVVESTESGVKPARTIISTVSVPSLLAASVPGADMPGRVLRLSDPTGTVLAESSGAFDPSALPGEVLDIATMATHDSDGRATLSLPGVTGWQIVVAAPIPLVAMPVQALAALAAMLLLLVVFTIWMARQILRPAAQLESQRTTLRELYETAREAALRDSLTGLGNHRAFQEAVARMVDGAHRYGTAFSLVLIDIDEFKRINDTRGHAVGDQLLSEVGALISSTIRNTDAAFRVGGDEFALLLPHTDVGGAIVLARRLLQRGLEDRTHGEYRAPISFSAGVTACPEFGTTRMELTAQADAALYRGKRAGRTVVTIYDPDKDHGHVDEGMRAELSSAITAVIEAGSLTPVYQPIVELETGRVMGYEGLVRVPTQSTFAHTGALFDAAEVAGRVHDLDRAALEVVLRGARDMDDSVTLSVNVSPRTLESAQFSATAFLAILRRHGFAPGRVILELTEREAIRDPERLRVALRGVQIAGVRVAADDVGAGNAGLRLLSQFQFDVVKIDLSLVQRAGDDRTHSVLRSIVEVAQRMNARTIAEGVETSSQLRTARRLGITAGQGYLLGRPGTDRDLPWVDIAALEQRDEVPIPVVADTPPVEPVRWGPMAQSEDLFRPDAPRGPFVGPRGGGPLGGDAVSVGGGGGGGRNAQPAGRKSFSFLRAGRKAADE